jgi:mono/diheme cytochrome c family protein
MRNFVLGMIFAVVAIAIVGAGAALLGFLPTRANAAPPDWERHFATSALDNSVERHAARANNPVPPTDGNLIDGLKIYTMNCAGCHGGIDRKPVDFGQSFYPPAPNFMLHPPDDPEWHLYYVIENGVRYTGMPAWDKMLSETDRWKLTALLARMEKLPPAVQEYWKNAGGAAASESGEGRSEVRGQGAEVGK